jgi:dienelactone hydrolase
MSSLDSWHSSGFDAEGMSHRVYRKGSGPAVILIHEMPGITPDAVDLGEELVAAGFTVVMPSLFGRDGAELSATSVVKALPAVCVSREFVMFARGKTSPVTVWLRALARNLHAELGGPGVGAVGMCFTGGFALAMMIDESVVAPVTAQPSLPIGFGRKQGADLGLSPADLEIVTKRANAGCAVLGLRYEDDKLSGTRFETLTAEIGDAFMSVQFAGAKHSTLTSDRQQEGVERVLAFLGERLHSK